jgi:small GTP-binding protein
MTVPAAGPEATTAVLQTAPGRGGIAVISLRGDGAADVLAETFRTGAGGGWGRLQLGRIVDGDRVIDEAVVHAGNECVEINIHGGSAVGREVLGLLERKGVRLVPAPAAASESFAAAHPRWNNPAIGREMLETLGSARTRRVAAAVTRQWAAGISELVCGDPRGDELREAASGLAVMRTVLTGPEVVLIGPPNAGKSALTNALVGRAVSIVHDQAGTTRDWVREPAAFEGLGVYLTDTAGLWAAADGIDAEAVRRARHRAEQADLVLLLSAETTMDTPEWLHARNVLRVSTQCDRHPPADDADVAVSTVTGQGLDELAARVLTALGLADFDPTKPMAFTARQADLLNAAAADPRGPIDELLRGAG